MVFGSFVCNVLQHAVGYIWPAYQCFKGIEQKNTEVVRQWCTYWFILAIFSSAEVVGDTFVFWLPFYYEAKVAFVVYLWHPKTKGAIYLYNNVVSPLLQKHEGLIDRKLAEGSSWFGDLFSSGMKRAIKVARDNAEKIIGMMKQYQPQIVEAMGQAEAKKAH